MTFILIIVLSILGGLLAGEHFHSYLLGLGVASTAVGACYWITFRSSHYPQFALFLLLLGVVAKIAVTAAGVLLGLKIALITSPLVFSLSYLFFLFASTYCYFRYREYWLTRLRHRDLQ
ncbi:NADH:ubiquinone oxidoreductase [Salinivibrio kushneri]|uniref:NADH:ubiquinone oxidoreductase n=1 Tax=Salinivibrio kushneri TaxID=1908198 RepID=A0AB36K199_9GAMM|nr:NADH:ubiquinone oxidoreductase [Salinivibrio kushneri]OOE40575.1 NADH:ubiquinone oxidoreductase [Salinivibrio kushneri]QCP03741.1 NADH:ubiquinone oxidoreductase [Salinivibrio kushneri]